jgi:protein gp37
VNTGGLSANLLQQLESQEVEKVIEKTRFYAPQLSDRWEDVVRAYHLRCVARNAVRLKVRSMAVKLIHQSLTTYWRIMPEEPRHTFTILAAAYLLLLLPQHLYSKIEALAAKIIGASQKRRIIQNHSKQLLSIQDSQA